jgi:RNA polymerase sigma factor (sigma-70 family)
MANILPYPDNRDLHPLGWAELISACARDRGDSDVWKEFLQRYGLKIRQFIRSTLQMSVAADAVIGQGLQCSDLFQSTIVRLVENDCAALKRFSGTSEDQWFAYLAVITRSVVRDSLRRQRSLKRGSSVWHAAGPGDLPHAPGQHPERAEFPAWERELLAREVRTLCERTIHEDAGKFSQRDLAIFRLYFEHDLSVRQIAGCRGIDLKKTGVTKVIDRLKNRIRGLVATDASVREGG